MKIQDNKQHDNLETSEVLHNELKTVDHVAVEQSGLYVNVNTTLADQQTRPKISGGFMAGRSGVKICELWDYISYMKKDSFSFFHQEFDVSCILFSKSKEQTKMINVFF